MTKPAPGLNPSAPPVKVYSTDSFPEGASSKTTPHPARPHPFPPMLVVPYKFPAASLTSGPDSGVSPSLQFGNEQNVYNTLSVQLPSGWGDTSKTTPHPDPPSQFKLPPLVVVP